MDKKDLRKIIRNQAAELSAEYIEEASRDIANRVINAPEFIEAKTIFAFISTDSEPQMKSIIEYAWHLGKRVCVPRCFSKHEMQAHRIYCFADLIPGAYGIPEPDEECELILPKMVDLVIVPCLSASKDGRRLGHGAGFYDNYLRNHDAYKMCVCFEKLLNEDIPVDENDVRMDCVISDHLKD